ncbi:MAG: M48 family metallopeptidase [Wenzhouxiangella sp.]|nr:M48 family metallopeptidase [Wenzhouxiangella sp.]
MTDSIQFGSKTITYSLRYSERKTLGITVTPEMDVLANAPKNAPLDKIREKIRKRAPWILKQQSYFLRFHPKSQPRAFISGETHLFLGKRFRLKVIIGKEESVKYKSGRIEVVARSQDRVENLMKKWYLQHAQRHFHRIAQPLIDRFKTYGVEPSSIVIREMPLRWGSCTPKGKIMLNPELIKAPKACIEYVIVHELCHLVHHDHTKAFFDLQTREMADWEKWKERLEIILA